MLGASTAQWQNAWFLVNRWTVRGMIYNKFILLAQYSLSSTQSWPIISYPSSYIFEIKFVLAGVVSMWDFCASCFLIITVQPHWLLSRPHTTAHAHATPRQHMMSRDVNILNKYLDIEIHATHSPLMNIHNLYFLVAISQPCSFLFEA